MWTQLSADDVAGSQEQVPFMRLRELSSARIGTAILVASIGKRQGEVWHYQGNGFDVGLLLQYSPEREQWQLMYVGFTDNVQPLQALDLTVDRLRDFFQSHGVSSVFVVPVKATESRALAVFYNACPSHPHLQVRIASQTESNVLWELSYVGT